MDATGRSVSVFRCVFCCCFRTKALYSADSPETALHGQQDIPFNTGTLRFLKTTTSCYFCLERRSRIVFEKKRL